MLDQNGKVSGRLVVVSNRLPLTLSRQDGEWRERRSSGGLATAMDPLLKGTGGIWIGWHGDQSGDTGPERQRILEKWEKEDGAVSVDLPAELVTEYYEGYPNQAVWPLFHYLPSRLRFDPKSWDAYVEGNRRFCEAVVRHAGPDDRIWVHDYQLMLLPSMLRERLPEARIGFFLHIPFPSSEVFGMLPRRDEVLDGLLGADLVAFHTHRYLHHFRAALLRILGIESGIETVAIDGRAVRLAALPIGIASEDFKRLIWGDEETARHYGELKARYEGQQVIVSVDRLDYTKGLPQRLRTFRRLFEAAPELRGKVTLIQVAVPSREGIESYQDLRSEVNELVGEINGKLGTTGWTPVVYINRGIARSELAALYQLGDVAWVSPLRDGMNLVAKEFAASKPEGDGVLVLSEFAGAAPEMGEALFVNPYDEERTAEVVLRALRMDPEERRDRMKALTERVRRNDVFSWGNRFLAELDKALEARESAPEGPRHLDAGEAVRRFAEARRRLLILDYDGTLAPYANLPHQAVPPRELTATLELLAGDPANCVAIVSGRRAGDLDRWFGHLRGLILAAEHGAKLRDPDGAWTPLRDPASRDWKTEVRPILEHFVDRTPGSFVEEKEYSLVWHYRMAEPDFGEWLAGELVALLESILAQTDLRAYRGRKTVEVKPTWANKGSFVTRLLEMCPGADFRFAAGDDRTDEDLFAALDAEAWTVRVGGGASRAAYTLPDVRAVRALLDRFAASESRQPPR